MPPSHSYPKARIEIKPSIILPGKIGVFAARHFAKDAVIVPVEHLADVRLLEWSVFETLDAVTQRKLMGYCPGTPEGLLAPPDLNYISAAWQMNHSCQPNVGFKGQIAAARRAAHGLIERSFCRTSFTALTSANATRAKMPRC